MLKIAWHPVYKHPLPEGHRFPMIKYELLPQQLLHEGCCTEANFFTAEPAADEDILRVHTAEYYNDLQNLSLNARASRKTGFPLSAELVEREITIAGGTIKGCEYALEYGIAMNIAGGTHHAYSDHGEAFCLLNDQAIAAAYLLHHKKANRILIIDLDVHQGNGTAEIFTDEPDVFTFSMHGKNNYPFKKEQSDLDIELSDNTGDEEYLKILQSILPGLLETIEPDFIFYLCGVDVIASDKLGKLGLSIDGCRQRDAYVLETCRDYGIPVQCSMGGGYSPDIKVIIEAHSNTFRLAQSLYF
ncbi:histone deacetylase [Robertkochia solimangrovi]|uniref:histone deacetylase family protein n=1 Tax=Robertkochia solimangrovi TaxID=2213046 RepID=UPI001180293D|nr:histone deacetylase [Robertkochia solimangrovi]TRZ46425.1 histone deacetylase [Robertkochia solimangrovi]